MSFPKKIVTTYAKVLFQTIKQFQPVKEKRVFFDMANLSPEPQEKTISANIFIVGEELLLLSSTIVSSKKLNDFYKNPTYSEKQKIALLKTIFPGLTKVSKAFLRVLQERNHLYLIPEIAREYSKILLAFKNIKHVKLSTAGFLEENSSKLMLDTLKKVTNSKSVILNVFYDPRLLAGLVIEYKSKLIDFSILKEFSLLLNEI